MDLQGLVEHFPAHDVSVAMGPMPAAGMHVVFIHGPDDVLMEFAQVPLDA